MKPGGETLNSRKLRLEMNSLVLINLPNIWFEVNGTKLGPLIASHRFVRKWLFGVGRVENRSH
jgi:hypothetical protein